MFSDLNDKYTGMLDDLRVEKNALYHFHVMKEAYFPKTLW